MTESDYSEFVEVDPTGRYGRYNEILGKGASKTVYRAFDEYEGIEVAWNQVKLYDFLQSPEDLERLYSEIHLLKTLKHKNIMKFYTSWVDTANRNINFVTEMFTSGTLRQYRQKHKRVNIRAIKHWCRQILNGLVYLHNHDPPVIHRDLKCDNIFINGNQGEVKIGDLGLAAILRKSHVEHCVGTPEFMAPEVYLEEYNELVDIYSFGMCILEMVTFEYPYSECTHPAQIYKKVISGKKPDVLYQVKDPDVRQFIEKCLATVSLRLSAKELLNDPFLQIDNGDLDLKTTESHYVTKPFLEDDYENNYAFELQNEWTCHPNEFGIELFEIHENEHSDDLDITIKGKRREDGSIFLRLRISDKEGRIRNIYFPFDIELDTALSVATEMVAELDITDQDVTNIADMIDGEITLLLPEWKPGPGIEETPRFANSIFCHNCASNNTSTGSFMNFLSDNGNVSKCLGNGCAASHGRFEEITYQVDTSSPNQATNNLVFSNVSQGFHNPEMWDRIESLECSSRGSGESQSLEESKQLDEKLLENEGLENKKTEFLSGSHSKAIKAAAKSSRDFSMDYEHIQQELRWLKARSKIKLREFRDKHLGFVRKSTRPPVNVATKTQKIKNGNLVNSSECHDLERKASQRDLITNQRFYNSTFLSTTHRRTTSLPIDAVDI